MHLSESRQRSDAALVRVSSRELGAITPVGILAYLLIADKGLHEIHSRLTIVSVEFTRAY